jgi:hypothetical protein
MMRFFYLSLLALLCAVSFSYAQWQTVNQLSNLNTWSAQPGYIGWYGTSSNTPTSVVYGSGVQTVLQGDSRFGSQIVIPTYDNQIYYRSNTAGSWDPWYKVWSSANLDPDTYLDRSVESISSGGSANSFSNGYTFAYAVSGTPWNGSLISYGGIGSSYDTQINSDYGPNGGNHISFRTKQGDFNFWNNWNELYHSGNLNRSDADFTAKNLTAANIYNNGNLWSKQVVVALTNPWADYVFKSTYRLSTLAEVKAYIAKNHHLADMPSEQEVVKSGINLGEMDIKLLRKVEELTLYLVDLKRDNDELRQQNKTLKQNQQAINQKLKRHHLN